MEELVSIITPCYNCEAFVGQTIKSVLTQDYSNWELLIVDDCSTDDSCNIISEFVKTDSRIKLFKNEKNSGAAFSRNFALKNAKGVYIAFLDADDIWDSKKLSKQVSFMKQNSYSFTYTNFTRIDIDNNPFNIITTGPDIITKRMMFRSNYVGCLTVMYDARVVGTIEIPDTIKKRNDYALWLKVIKKTDCHLLNETLASYRVGRVGSVSSVSIKKMLKFHYLLFRQSEQLGVLASLFFVFENLLFGVLRKKKYTLHLSGEK